MKLLPTLSAALVLLTLSPALRSQEVSILQDGDSDEYLVIQFNENGSPLVDFLKLVQMMTEQQVRFSQRDVEAVEIQSFGSARIAKKDFRKFAEATLYGHGFLLVPYGDALHLAKTSGGFGAGASKPGYLKAQADFVPPDRLAEYEGRYVVLTTTFTLKHTNVQEATNMLQTYFTDPMMESVRAMTNSNSLVVTGLPHTLLAIQKLLASVDVPAPDDAGPGGTFQQRIQMLESKVARLEKKVAALSDE